MSSLKAVAQQRGPWSGLVKVIAAVLLMQTGAGAQRSLEELRSAYRDMRFGLFLHYNMSTYARQMYISVTGEHEEGFEDPNLFQPTDLDCGQWADVAKLAGMKYVILTVKHHGGFCIWNSEHTEHDIGSTTWRDGKEDIVREFVDSVRSRGLAVGFYFSTWDKTNGEDTTFIKNQLTELLTNYGPITVMWFDGWAWMVGYGDVPYASIRDHIKSIQPECLVLDNNHFHNLDSTELMVYERPVEGIPPAGNEYPGEVCGCARRDQVWFYHPPGNCDLYSAQEVVDDLEKLDQRNCNYLFDLTPDDRGLIPECQVELAREIGRLRGVEPIRVRRAGLPRGIEITHIGNAIEIEGVPRGNARIALTDIRGKLAYTAPITGSLVHVLPGLAAGTYLLRISSNNGSAVTRIIQE